MIHLLEEQLAAKNQGRPYALATVVNVAGSTPRGVGVKMMVYEDGSFVGTVGGGYIEQNVIKDAVACIKKGSCVLKEYENSYGSEPNCGGQATVYIDVEVTVPLLVICGLGHVGAAVARTAAMMDWEIIGIDTRDEEIILENAKIADRFYHVDDFREGIKNLQISSGAYYLVSTYSHDTDAEAMAAVLDKEPRYAGMMGSPGKIKTVREKLLSYGHQEKQVDFIHAPIGLDIGGSTPPEIGLSIMGEIQMIRYGRTGKPMKIMQNEIE